MRNRIAILLLMLMPTMLLAQSERDTDFGTALSAELVKGLTRNINLSIEEEVRLTSTPNIFERSVTSVGVDYSLLNKRVKVGGYYAFIYLYNDKHLYEARHRFYLNLMYKEDVTRQLSLSWRGRFQGTYRDENRGEYKINPKYIMKNRVQAEYALFGKPWKPFVSVEFSSELNNPKGNELTRIRYQAGTSWRLNRTDYLDFYLRFDDYMDKSEPRAIMLGVGYKVKL